MNDKKKYFDNALHLLSMNRFALATNEPASHLEAMFVSMRFKEFMFLELITKMTDEPLESLCNKLLSKKFEPDSIEMLVRTSNPDLKILKRLAEEALKEN